ncbi:MAG: B12-binding domain-containing radical SAM protein [Acetobacteraceae bacterium]|nr:B12-binding domain-containing radical SAM protein [Acetobacteraceae bacterium]
MGIPRRALFVAVAGSTQTREIARQAAATPPLGLMSIASVLRMHGWQTALTDLLVEDLTRQEFLGRVSRFAPGVIGLSCYTETVNATKEVAREARSVCPHAIIVVGGPHPSFDPEAFLADGTADYVVMREGEASIVELAARLECGLDGENVRGVAYRRNGKIVVNQPRPYLQCLDQLPFTAYDLAPRDAYVVATSIVSSRGCPGRCAFCASASLSGHRYRARSPEHLFSEVYHRYLQTRDRYFVLFDDAFTTDTRRVLAFCRLLRYSGLGLVWRCDSRVDAVDEALLAELAASGCIAVHYGVESGDQGVLDSIGKKIRVAQVERVVAATAELGMKPMCSFIIGHAEDTEETVARTVAFMRHLKDRYGAVVAYSCLVPYPGTPVARRAAELGLRVETQTWEEYNTNNVIISTRHLSRERLRELLYDVRGDERLAGPAGLQERGEPVTPAAAG